MVLQGYPKGGFMGRSCQKTEKEGRLAALFRLKHGKKDCQIVLLEGTVLGFHHHHRVVRKRDFPAVYLHGYRLDNQRNTLW